MGKSVVQLRLRRAKESERRLGRWMMEHDGPDPIFRPGGGIVTTTGRVGHVTGLQFDTLSRSYAGENKNEKVPMKLWRYWMKVVDRARLQGKEPMIRYEPTNPETRVNGWPIPNMHIISEERHAELLRAERALIEKDAKLHAHVWEEEGWCACGKHVSEVNAF